MTVLENGRIDHEAAMTMEVCEDMMKKIIPATGHQPTIVRL